MRLIVFLLFTLNLPNLLPGQTPGQPLQIHYGTNHETEISTPGEIDYYTFFGNKGDLLLIRMRDDSKVDAYFKIYNDQGQLIGSAWSDGGLSQIRGLELTKTGNYTIEAFDRNHNDTGKYGLSLHVLNNNQYAPSIPSIISFTDSIITIVGVNTYQFDAELNDRYFGQMRASTVHFECDFFLYDSGGNEVARSKNTGRLATIGPLTLTKADRYTLVVMDRGGNDLDYFGFSSILLNKHEEAPDLDCASNITDAISQLCERKVFRFRTNGAGRPLFEFRSENSSLEGRIELYDEQGNFLDGITKTNQLLSLMGPKYDSLESILVVVSDQNGNDFGSFGLQSHLIGSDHCQQTFECETLERSAHITALANSQLYSIQGYQGDTIDIVLRETAAILEPAFRLYDKEGNLLLKVRDPEKAVYENFIFPYTGVFYLLAHDQSGNDTGIFNLQVINKAMQPSLPECVTIYHGFEPFCGTTLNTGLSTAYSFQWSTGENKPEIEVCFSESQMVTVEVVNAAGCRSYAETYVEVVDVTCGSINNPKIQICHVDTNTGIMKDKCIDEDGVWGHLENGEGHENCFLGPCIQTSVCQPESGETAPKEANTRSVISLSEPEMSVFPNPTSDVINILPGNAWSGGMVLNASLISTEGKKCAEWKMDSNSGAQMQVSLRKLNLTEGIYYLMVEDGIMRQVKQVLLLN